MTLRKIKKSPVPMNPIILAAWEIYLRSNKKLYKKKGNVYLRDKWDNYTLAGTLCDLHRIVSFREWEEEDGKYYYLNESVFMPLDVLDWAFGIDDTHDKYEEVVDVFNEFSDLFVYNLRWPTNRELYQAFTGDYEREKAKRRKTNGAKKSAKKKVSKRV